MAAPATLVILSLKKSFIWRFPVAFKPKIPYQNFEIIKGKKVLKNQTWDIAVIGMLALLHQLLCFVSIQTFTGAPCESPDF